MRRSRIVLLSCSAAVVMFILGSGVALKAGPVDGTYRQVLLFSEVLSYAVDNYVDPVDTDKLMRGAHEGLMNGLDAHGADGLLLALAHLGVEQVLERRDLLFR